MSDEDPTAIALELDPLVLRMRGTAMHGNTPFDVPYVSHIKGNLWTGGCASSLVLPPNIVHLVSLYPWEGYTVEHELRSVLRVRMYDSVDQSFAQVGNIAAWVNGCCEDGPTLLHCQAGLNRSALVAAYALMIDGMSASDAIALLREKRSPAVLCNKSFEAWLRAAA